MALATYIPSTSATDLNNVWRKVQTDLQQAAQFAVDEWDMLDDIDELDVALSAREIIMPVDFTDEVGIASITEGGYEARPSSVDAQDATLTWIFLNGRITLSVTARMLDRSAKGRRAMIARQLLYQGRKKIEAMRRRVGDMFYGQSAGIDALVNGSPSSEVFTLDSMYNVAGLGDVGESRVVTDMFRVGEFVSIMNPSGPTPRGAPVDIITVTPATPSITLSSTPSGSATNDYVILANSLENHASNLSATDYNKALTGLIEINTATSLHSLSGATYPSWNAGSDTTGGRLDGIRLRRAKQVINNEGGGMMNTVIWSQGIENDVLALYQSNSRFVDSFSLEMDGSPKFKGVKFMSTRFVPGGYAFCFDKRSLRKFSLVPKPGEGIGWEDGHKLENQSGFVFPFDFPLALIATNRANFYYFSGLTEQV